MAWNLRGLPLTRLHAKTSPPLARIAAALDGVPSMPETMPDAPAPLGAFGPEHLPLNLGELAGCQSTDAYSELHATTFGMACPASSVVLEPGVSSDVPAPLAFDPPVQPGATPPRANLRARWRRGVLVPMNGPPVIAPLDGNTRQLAMPTDGVSETAIACMPSLVVPSAPPPPPPPPASDSDIDFSDDNDEPSSEGECPGGPAPPPGVIIVSHTTIINFNTTHFHGRVDNVNLGCGNVAMFRGHR